MHRLLFFPLLLACVSAKAQLTPSIPLETISVSPQPHENETIRTTSVYFGSAESTLTPEAIRQLDTLIGWLKTVEIRQLEIRGHTDNLSSKAYNQALSQARAEAVQAYLTRQGIPVKPYLVSGYDFSLPVTDNRSEPGKAANRRAEIRTIYRERAPASPEPAPAPPQPAPVQEMGAVMLPPVAEPATVYLNLADSAATTFTCRQEVVITGKKGVKVVIPAGAIPGDSCESHVIQAELDEYLAPEGIPSPHVSTRLNDGLMFSAGMVSVCIMVDDQPGMLTRPISVSMPFAENDPEIAAYISEDKMNADLNWAQAPNNPIRYDSLARAYVMDSVWMRRQCMLLNWDKKAYSVITRITVRKKEAIDVHTRNPMGMVSNAWVAIPENRGLLGRNVRYLQVAVCDNGVVYVNYSKAGAMAHTYRRQLKMQVLRGPEQTDYDYILGGKDAKIYTGKRRAESRIHFQAFKHRFVTFDSPKPVVRGQHSLHLKPVRRERPPKHNAQ